MWVRNDNIRNNIRNRELEADIIEIEINWLMYGHSERSTFSDRFKNNSENQIWYICNKVTLQIDWIHFITLNKLGLINWLIGQNTTWTETAITANLIESESVMVKKRLAII